MTEKNGKIPKNELEQLKKTLADIQAKLEKIEAFLGLGGGVSTQDSSNPPPPPPPPPR